MRQKLAAGLGTLLIASGLLGASLTFAPSGLSADAQERRGEEQTRSEAHEQMQNMMNMMMGEGASDRMHAAMRGSEEMMGACASGMGTMMNSMMHGGRNDMMNGQEGQ